MLIRVQVKNTLGRRESFEKIFKTKRNLASTSWKTRKKVHLTRIDPCGASWANIGSVYFRLEFVKWFKAWKSLGHIHFCERTPWHCARRKDPRAEVKRFIMRLRQVWMKEVSLNEGVGLIEMKETERIHEELYRENWNLIEEIVGMWGKNPEGLPDFSV